MKKRAPLTQAEKERIYEGKLQERTLGDMAHEVCCSVSCARKWWRRGHDHGWQGLRARQYGPKRTGILSRFDERIADKSLTHKRSHPRWGADRVLIELRKEPELTALKLPKRSRLAAFFKERCPECVASRKPRKPAPARPPRVTGVHELWQLDTQEGTRLHDGSIASICNIRDPVGAAMIASQSFSVKTGRHWRKLTVQEVRSVLRAGFSEWKTLPDGVQTDNELVLTGSPTDPYPSLLTLWLRGLGVKHCFIRPNTPTDQPHVERNHRTLDDFALNEEALTNLTCLQQALDRERRMYNHEFPSRASDCAGYPPLVAHPELLQPRRFYQPELELALFDMQRVYDYLATFTFERKVSASGQVSLGRRIYSVGRPHAGKSVLVCFDACQQQWVFFAEPEEERAEEQEKEELARRALKDLDIQTLTELNPEDFQPAPPMQLTFPCFVG